MRASSMKLTQQQNRMKNVHCMHQQRRRSTCFAREVRDAENRLRQIGRILIHLASQENTILIQQAEGGTKSRERETMRLEASKMLQAIL